MSSTGIFTIVFTDLVGSTELLEKLGDDGAELLRRTHFAVLRKAIDETGGEEVKNLGDGLMIAFRSVADALHCSVAMQQGIQRHNHSRGGTQLGLRVGVSVGEATSEENDYFGTPVVEAARLCARAEGGQILTTALAQALAGQRGFSFASVGDLELKGLSEPVAAVEVDWSPAAEAEIGDVEVPLPRLLEASADRLFVGREAEAAVLAGLLTDIEAGKGPRAALIGGEPGLGKTTLSSRLAADAHRGGAVVLYGRCDEELAIPYQPFAEAIGHLVQHAPPALLDAHLRRHGGELARLVPGLAERVELPALARTGDPDAERYLLFAAVVGLVHAVTEMGPLVLVLDDLHWADKASLLLLRHLLAGAGSPPLLVVGTYRDSEVSSTHPLADTLAALRRVSGVERIALGGLDDREVVDLLAGTAGHDLDETGVALAHLLRTETNGNPFFAREILRHLVETGVIYREDERWVGADGLTGVGLPESVREVVGQRVARLGDSSHRVLSMAAVIGRDFDFELLGRVCEASEDELLDVLEAACRASVVEEVTGAPGRFSFAHALVQSTLYEDLGAARRARVHGRVAEALEVVCGDDPGDRVGELARHWLAATRPVETSKALQYAQRAGDRALAGVAPDEAARWYATAVGLLDDDPGADVAQRCDVLIGLGTAQRQSGEPAYRQTLLDAARLAKDHGLHDHLVRAVLANNRGFGSASGQVDDERIGVLESALDAVGPDDSAARARLLVTLASELTYAGDVPGRIALVREAEAVARRVGDPQVILDTLNLSTAPTWIPPELERRVAVSAEAVELAARLDDPSARFWAAHLRAAACGESGDLGGFEDAVGQMQAVAASLGQPVLRWMSATWTCTLTGLGGDTERAEQLAIEALQVGNDAEQPDAMVFFGAELANIRWAQGRLFELVALIADVAEQNPGIPGYRVLHALALLEGGEDDASRSLLAVEAAARFGFPMDPVWASSISGWAEIASRLGDRDACAVLIELLTPWENQVPMPSAFVQGSVSHYLALAATTLERYDDAERWFAAALVTHERMRAAFFSAQTNLAWAQMLAARGEAVDQARRVELVGSARALAEKFGFAAVERRARTALD